MTLLRFMLAKALDRVALSVAGAGLWHAELQMDAGEKVGRVVRWRVKTAAALLALANRIDR